MGIFSRFENKAEDMVEGSTHGGLEPVKIAKRAAKEMQREKMVGVGHEYAPTLYNVLVSEEDDIRMSGYYPSLAGEIETYLASFGKKNKMIFDCPPLVRFIVDATLKHGRFDVIAENVSPAIISDLRHEEMLRYGIDDSQTNKRVAKTVKADEFDPFTPSDMQSAPYIPADAHDVHADIPAPAPTPVIPVGAAAAAVAMPQVDTAANTVMLNTTAASPYLLNVDNGKTNTLVAPRMTLGRGTDNDVIVSDASVSRHHGVLIYDGAWTYSDLGSTNGSAINGMPATRVTLRPGDVLTLGNTQLEYRED